MSVVKESMSEVQTLPPSTLLKPTRFSPSAINEFYSCPKQWELHRKGVIRLPTNRDYMDLGRCVHDAIKIYFGMIGDKPTRSQIKKVFTTVFEQEFEKYSLGHFRIRANRLCQNFISFERDRLKTWNSYRPTLIEEKLRTDTYVTIVDFYSKPHKTLIDWKTGNKRDLTDNDLRQGKVMDIVLRKHKYPVERILFVALYPNRVFEVPKIGDGFVENERTKMEESIKLNYFPKRGKWCQNCDVVLSCELEGSNLWLL